METATISTQDMLDDFLNKIQPLKEKLSQSKLYSSIKSHDDLIVFMEHHVFAVWEYMSLLKSLQNTLTCVTLPWYPQSTGSVRRLINEIVVHKESDLLPNGECISHFELYLRAMQEVGADTSKIESFIKSIKQGESVEKALKNSDAPAAVQKYLNYSWQIISHAEAHQIAAAFAFGREDGIPSNFLENIKTLNKTDGGLSQFELFLDRHVCIDKDEYIPRGKDMIAQLCGQSEEAWQAAESTALKTLEHRIDFFHAIQKHILLKKEY